MVDDAELLRRYADTRSEEAFTALVERHLSLVYHAAFRRIGQAQLAEDATQYVFIALARNASALSRHAVLAGWLYTTTRFAAQRILRVERRRQLREQEAYAMQDALSPPDPDWDRLRPALDGVMDQLSDRDRAAVLLRYFEGRSFADVGRALELTEEATRKRVERGLEKLRVLLARRGISSTATALATLLSAQVGSAAPAGLAASVLGPSLAAGGSGLSATGLGLVGIMSASKTTWGIASLAVVLGLIATGHEFQAARRAEAAADAEAQENVLRSARIRTLNHETDLAEKAVADLQQSISALPPASSAPATWDSAEEGRKFLAAHPEAKPLLKRLFQYYAMARYGPFLQSLNLTPAQIDKLQDQLAKVSPTTVLQTPAGVLQLSLDDATPSSASMQAELRGVFGDAMYQQMRDYFKQSDRLDGTQEISRVVARDTYFTPTPLTAIQAAQLGQVLAQNSANFPANGAGGSSGSIAWGPALDQAKKVLSPVQLAALQAIADGQEYRKAMMTAAQGSSGQNPGLLPQ